MLVAMFFGQIKPVQVLRDLPHLGFDGVVIDLQTIDVRPTERLCGSKAATPRYEHRNAG